MIRKIISGGQTGADRAALDWAISAGVPPWRIMPEGQKGRGRPDSASISTQGDALSGLPLTHGDVAGRDLRRVALARVLAPFLR